MQRIDLRNIDLNLLVIFEAVMQERNLTKAAERLSLKQPAVSSALGRLRSLFNDPVFERIGRRMEPTARASSIFQILGPALDSVLSALAPIQEFHAQSSDAVFRIGVSDDVEFALLPQLLDRLRNEAPGVVVNVRRVNSRQMSELLISGEISAGIGYVSAAPKELVIQAIRTCETVLVRADFNPADVTLDEFTSRPHALVAYGARDPKSIDTALKKSGRKRRVALAVTQFQRLGEFISGTDFLAAVPDFTQHVFSSKPGLRVSPMPLTLDPFELQMVWRKIEDLDPAQVWLRSQIVGAFSDQMADQKSAVIEI